MIRKCAICDRDMAGMKDVSRRKFCSRNCYGLSLIRIPATDAIGRCQANNLYSPTCCVRCGSTENIERHHRDRNPRNNSESNIEGLCRSCHHAEHPREIPKSICAVCGKDFIAKSHRSGRIKVCSVVCHKEWRRACAFRQWQITGNTFQVRNKSIGS